MSETKTWEREEFIWFLENTLIPDLKESGRHATAEDFETAVFFMKGETVYDKVLCSHVLEYPDVRIFERSEE
tara:strand:+ start:144 stop:359 length:216 start_codon:yes stop_codon:yes gene_type:complete